MNQSEVTQQQLEYKAPVALFVYNRDDHVRQTIDALIKCQGFSESKIVVFCDGSKGEKDFAGVTKTREVVHEMLGSTATIIESDKNRGLANSIISGVTKLCNEYGRVIVLEDDLVVSPVFLTYMNTALDKYENVDEVMQISGHMFPVVNSNNEKEAFFLPFTTTWGWATWKESWSNFSRSPDGWLEMKKNRKLRREFNLNNSYNYFGMLAKQVNGQIDSWGILWRLSVFMKCGLTLYPHKSLVNNIGFDGSGTHTKGSVHTADNINCIVMPLLPDCGQINVNVEVYDLLTKYLKFKNNTIIKIYERISVWVNLRLNNRKKILQ